MQKQSQKGQQHRLVVQQSMTSLNNALQVKQEKFNKKKQGYLNLIESLKSTIADLKEEIIQLHSTIRQETKSFRIANESANQNQYQLQKLTKKINRKEEEMSTISFRPPYTNRIFKFNRAKQCKKGSASRRRKKCSDGFDLRFKQHIKFKRRH